MTTTATIAENSAPAAPPQNAALPSHSIRELWLEHYRNYAQARVEVTAKPVIIRGENGAGKTNLLEAISLLSPGRGFRNATLSELNPLQTRENAENAPPHQRAKTFTVFCKTMMAGQMQEMGTAHQLSPSGRDQRVIQVNGEKLSKQTALTEYMSVLWLTPAMDPLFVSGDSERRKWLDRLVFVFDAGHAARVSAYEQAMRERTRILKQFDRPDAAWLSLLEKRMAETGVAILLARREALMRIVDAMRTMPGAFPKAALWLEGEGETLVEKGLSALDVEEALCDLLAQNRKPDKAAGRALKGVHKTRFQVKHLGKNMLAEYGSTGEQKAMLLSIVIATCLAQEKYRGFAPILLLDEVVAHLDVEKQHCLFDLVTKAGIQAWLTGTDASDFSALAPYANVLNVTGGTIHQASR